MKPKHMPTEFSVEAELSEKADKVLETVLSANHRGLAFIANQGDAKRLDIFEATLLESLRQARYCQKEGRR